ncbi:MAG: hypothetical protein AAGI68_16055 [Planctomycetota bacterium]
MDWSTIKSWFGGGASKKQSKRSRRRGGKKAAWDPARTVKGLKIAGFFAAVVGVTTGWFVTQGALVNWANARADRPLSGSDVVLVDAPEWTQAPARTAIRQVIFETTTAQPIDGEGLRTAAAALRELPWLEDVHQVRRRGDGTIAVSAAYRRPVAVVESANGYHLVDHTGVRLPLVYEAHHVTALVERGLPVIKGVSEPPPFEGELWAGSELSAGLDLLKQLAGRGWHRRVPMIDVGHQDELGRTRLLFVADQTRVVWGLPPGRERAVEPMAHVKLDALTPVMQPGFRLTPGFDAVSVSMGKALGTRLR